MGKYIDKEKFDITLMLYIMMQDDDFFCKNVIKLTELTKKAEDENITDDVQPVVHGHWEFVNQATSYLESPFGDTVKCSNCGFEVDVSDSGYVYCPKCGARMDGEKKE